MNTHFLLFTALLLTGVAVQASEPLRIGTDDWPPYEYQDDHTGAITGFSTELIRAVLTQMKLETDSIRVYPWARVEQEAKVGNIDMIYTLNPSDKRRAYLHFPSEPLDTDYGTLFVRNDQADKIAINRIEDLSPYSLAVVRGYQYSPEVRAFIASSDKVIEVTDEEQLFSMLARGRVDAVISYLKVGRAIIERLSLTDQVTALEQVSLFNTRYFAAFSRKTVAISVVENFSSALADYKSSEQYHALQAKYFGRYGQDQRASQSETQ